MTYAGLGNDHDFGAFKLGEHHIELASGAYLDLRDPDPTLITLADVARGLSRVCRFAGQSRRYYSVAEHACLVAAYLEAQGEPLAVILAGLHHDDAEAFLGDVTRPLKALVPDFAHVESVVMTAIEEALALPTSLGFSDWANIKHADDWALSAEAYHLLPSRGATWFCAGLFQPDEDCGVGFGLAFGLPPDVAREMYEDRHLELVERLAQAAQAEGQS